MVFMDMDEFLAKTGMSPDKIELTKQALEKIGIESWKTLVTYNAEDLASAINNISLHTAYLITIAAKKQIRKELSKKARKIDNFERKALYLYR